jgi:putative chitinase
VVNAIELQKLGIGLEWVAALNETFAKFGIATVGQQAAFIGQCSHECNKFKTLEENLNYKPETLMKLWPKRFPSMSDAMKYAHQPEKIANHIYSSRGGNGDEASGDGWKYHGRGCIQLTFKDNYYHCGQALGVDLVANPQLIASPKYAALSAGWFWSTHGCNALAAADDWTGLTKKINGGTFGLDERVALTKTAIVALQS